MNDLVPKSLAAKMAEHKREAKAWKPWEYQEQGLKFVLEDAQCGLLLDPGMGKTSTVLAALTVLLHKRLTRRALIVAPLRAVYEVWPFEVSDWKDFNKLGVAILHGGSKDATLRRLRSEHQIALINPEGLAWLFDKPERAKLLDADMLVIDECFATGTLVSTPQGQREIQDLKVNDLVCNELGVCRVLRVTAKPPVGPVVEVTVGQEKIRCTEDHPFFTDAGWLPAKCLTGRRVYSNLELYFLRQGVQKESLVFNARHREDLLEILCKETGVAARRRLMAQESSKDHAPEHDRAATLESGQALAEAIQTQSSVVGQEERPFLEEARWQWARSFESGAIGTQLSVEEVYLQLSSKVGREAARLSYLLQSRLWRTSKKAGFGSRWYEPCTTTSGGQEERTEAASAWVESVSYLKQGSVPLVYNLEVESCPHFEVAQSAVVHNSSKFKNSQSQRFLTLRKHLMKFKRRYILTGSPRPRNYEDLWGQIYILDRGAALGCYVTHYRNQFFYPTGYQMREWGLLPGADKKINALVAPMVLRLDAKDYLKLPSVPPDVIHKVELPVKVRNEYDAIETSLMSTLFEAPLVSSAAARSKLCQMANGSVYTDTAGDDRFPSKVRPVKALHTAKVDALVDLYDELQGEPLLVSVGFHHDVVAIRKALGKDVPCINSATTRAQAADFIDKWNRGQLDIMLGHPASMGHGLNLQGCGCRHVAFFDIPDDYDLYDQFFRRVWRQGNKSKFCFRHCFVVEGTVDEAKLINLRRKGSGQRAFLDAMKAYAEKKYGRVKR